MIGMDEELKKCERLLKIFILTMEVDVDVKNVSAKKKSYLELNDKENKTNPSLSKLYFLIQAMNNVRKEASFKMKRLSVYLEK